MRHDGFRRRVFWATLASALWFVAAASAATLKAGPYATCPIVDANGVSILVCWETDELPVRRGATCRKASTEGPAITGESTLPIKAGIGYLHRVAFHNLEAGTEYNYAISSDNDTWKGGFLTPPGFDTPVRIAVYGDCQTNHVVHREIVRCVADFKPQVVLINGDLTTTGQEWETEFWGPVDRAFSHSIVSACRGNHDLGRLFSYYFPSTLDPQPGEEGRDWSMFRYGAARIYRLNTETDVSEASEQYRWLESELKKDERGFVIVQWHQGRHSAARLGGDARMAPMTELLEKYVPGRALVLNGHNHGYARGEVNGVMHVTSAGAGGALYDITTQKIMTVALKVHHSMQLELGPKTLSARAVDSRGNEIDRFRMDLPAQPQ